MSWEPDRYLAFQAERDRPAQDLLSRVTNWVSRAVDLGCGPGNSTELVLRRFPGAAVMGVDNSPEMIAAARMRLPGVVFETADIAVWDGPGPFDLIFANASLQWLPDHDRLLPRLAGLLAPEGALAAQMPDNLEEPTHRAMREVAATGPWADRLAEAAGKRAPRRAPVWYFETLRRAGLQVEVWRTTYFHPLSGLQGIEDWFRGSGLRPYLEALPAEEQTGFLAAWREAIAPDYPLLEDGTALLRFPRLFLLARR